ncbi:hypothetical protein TrRE_jg1954, partial [Triparma retinervis]
MLIDDEDQDDADGADDERENQMRGPTLEEYAASRRILPRSFTNISCTHITFALLLLLCLTYPYIYPTNDFLRAGWRLATLYTRSGDALVVALAAYLESIGVGDSPEVWRGAFDYSDLSFHNFLTYWPKVVRLEGRMLRGSFEALRDTRIREARKWASANKKGKEREKEEKESGKGEVEGMK